MLGKNPVLVLWVRVVMVVVLVPFLLMYALSLLVHVSFDCGLRMRGIFG